MHALWGGAAARSAAGAKRARPRAPTRRRRRAHAMHLLVSCVSRRSAGDRTKKRPAAPEDRTETAPAFSVLSARAAPLASGHDGPARCECSDTRDMAATAAPPVNAPSSFLMHFADDDDSMGELDGVDFSALDDIGGPGGEAGGAQAQPAMQMDARTRRWTGNEQMDEFAPLAAASEAHAPIREPFVRDDAPFAAVAALRAAWVDDARLHNAMFSRKRKHPPAPVDIKRLVSLYVPP